jgi:cobalt/nickel transport system permease protein
MHHTLIDSLACGDTFAHRLDSRVKLITVILFSLSVLSVPPTQISILFCYAVGPFAMLVFSGVPLKLVAKQILFVSPFIAVLALSSIFYDRTAVTTSFGPYEWTTTAGVLRCFSIVGKFIITMSTLVLLAATTRFHDLLSAMDKLGVPKILIMQLSFLWRYIFMLIDRATHMLRARAGRNLRYLGIKTELKTAAAMTGSLLTTSVNTAQRVNMAMLARGFNGHLYSGTNAHTHNSDWIFVMAAMLYLLAINFFRGAI